MYPKKTVSRVVFKSIWMIGFILFNVQDLANHIAPSTKNTFEIKKMHTCNFNYHILKTEEQYFG